MTQGRNATRATGAVARGADAEPDGLLRALRACTEAVRELLALLRPPGDVDSYPGGRIGWTIYRARMARNWTPAQLAQLVGVSRSSIIAWELGRAHPSPRRWAQLVALFSELEQAGAVKGGRVIESEPEEDAAEGPDALR